MSWIKRLASSLRAGKLEEDLEKELEFHLDMRAREKTAAGTTPEEARHQVLRRFGSLTRTKDACRDQSTFTWVAGVGEDPFEKPFYTIPYYFLWGMVLRMLVHLRQRTLPQTQEERLRDADPACA